MAEELIEEGRSAEALTLLDVIEQRTPNIPDVMLSRARCIHALGRKYEARLLCNKLHAMHGDDRGMKQRRRWRAQMVDRGDGPLDGAESAETPLRAPGTGGSDGAFNEAGDEFSMKGKTLDPVTGEAIPNWSVLKFVGDEMFVEGWEERDGEKRKTMEFHYKPKM